jgi:hypothetical protein
MIALRAARAAHRLAGDVAASRIKDLSTVRCAACSRRFAEEAAEPGGRTLCPSCRSPQAGPMDPAVARVVQFVDVLCAELHLTRPEFLVENPAASGGPVPAAFEVGSSGASASASARAGARELWRFNGWRLQVLTPDDDGDYRPGASSPALPFLPLADLEQLLVRVQCERDETARRAFVKWVRALTPEAIEPE